MPDSALQKLQHSHEYNSNNLTGEKRTQYVVLLTLVMMAAEISGGIIFGSMALLADGWHMATHAFALGITLFAFSYARRNSDNPRFTFGTGKVGALGGYTSAVVLGIVALLMIGESTSRLFSPISIQFEEAIVVAIIGLIINIVSALLLQDTHHHHDHTADHGHHHDHNLRAAYYHVLADALTSVLAILALLAGKFLGWTWMDPIMGIIGALVISKWSYNLLCDASAILLDKGLSTKRLNAIRARIESDPESKVADLHVWPLGSHHFAAILSIFTKKPQTPDHYKERLHQFHELEHITIEIHTAS